MSRPEVNPKRTGLKAKKVVFTDEEFGAYSEPGGCEPHNDYLILACPGCGHVSGILCGHPKPGTSPSWDITGGKLEEPETLTLSPSINCVGCCKWHGYLRNGEFVSC